MAPTKFGSAVLTAVKNVFNNFGRRRQIRVEESTVSLTASSGNKTVIFFMGGTPIIVVGYLRVATIPNK